MFTLVADATSQLPWQQTFNALAMPCILLVSVCVAIGVYFQNRQQRQIDRAMALYQSLMTSEYLTKARLISQQFLLASESNPHFQKLAKLNYDELDIEFRKPEYGEDTRFYIRAIPNFFHTVHLAREQRYIKKNERLFSQIYAWYWVNIMESHCKGLEHFEMYREHLWMRTAEDKAKEEAKHKERLFEFWLKANSDSKRPIDQAGGPDQQEPKPQ